MVDPGVIVSTDQDLSSDQDIDVEIDSSSTYPYVLDLNADIEQVTEHIQTSEFNLDASGAGDNLAVAVDVDQIGYLKQKAKVDIRIDEDGGVVNVGVDVGVKQKIALIDEIEIAMASGAFNDLDVSVDQDGTTLQKLDFSVWTDESVLADVSVDGDQFAALLQDVDVDVDLSSANPVLDVDSVQDAEVDDSLSIALDIKGIKQA